MLRRTLLCLVVLAGAPAQAKMAFTVSMPQQMAYAKYFAIAGLKLDVKTEEAADGYIGLDTRTEEIPAWEMTGARRGGGVEYRLTVTDVAEGSPAEAAGLKAGNRILAIGGAKASAVALNDAINRTTPRGKTDSARERTRGTVIVGRNVKRTYRFLPGDAPAAQQRIGDDWLRAVQP